MQKLSQTNLKPFIFLNRWTKKEDFLDLVKVGWSIEVSGTPCYRIISKLKNVKRMLEEKKGVWQVSDKDIGLAQNRLKEVQEKLGTELMNLELAKKEHILKGEVNQLLLQ